MRAICDQHEAFLLSDMAHISGKGLPNLPLMLNHVLHIATPSFMIPSFLHNHFCVALSCLHL